RLDGESRADPAEGRTQGAGWRAWLEWKISGWHDCNGVSSRFLQRLFNVRPKGFNVLDAHGEAHQAVGDAGGVADVLGDGGVGHGGGMADEGFDAAEARRLGDQAQPADEGQGLVLRV